MRIKFGVTKGHAVAIQQKGEVYPQAPALMDYRNIDDKYQKTEHSKRPVDQKYINKRISGNSIC
jgi:hypothetical protein